jgi:hypothetical protein
MLRQIIKTTSSLSVPRNFRRIPSNPVPSPGICFQLAGLAIVVNRTVIL